LERVWEVLRDPKAVAACLPGAELISAEGERLQGRVLVRMGPIKAQFIGEANYTRDEVRKTGSVTGGGKDSLSNSRIQGQMDFSLIAPDPSATCVEISLSFTLQGMLAQFSRPSIVNDFSSYMIGLFADNLARQLSGEAPLEQGKRGSMDVLKMLRWWLGRFFPGRTRR
jgi:carbon-monoxide dehydrogenase small subunit